MHGDQLRSIRKRCFHLHLVNHFGNTGHHVIPSQDPGPECQNLRHRFPIAGSGIAGVAGVALSQMTSVGPNLGQSYIIDSFVVVVFGGVGNLWGSLIGGLSMGIMNNLLEPHVGAVLSKILLLVALIFFIQARPRGLFPQTGRAAEDK